VAELSRQILLTKQFKASITRDAKNLYENENRSKRKCKVNSGPTGCAGTQETESDGVGVVCSDDIAREHSDLTFRYG